MHMCPEVAANCLIFFWHSYGNIPELQHTQLLDLLQWQCSYNTKSRNMGAVEAGHMFAHRVYI